MRNLLVGNGINCHFDNVSYSSKQIVLRILKNVHRSDFPMSIIADPPYALKDYLGLLFIKAKEVVSGGFDRFAVSSAEKESIRAFKEKYSDNFQYLRMTDICFEDYYLLHDICCHSIGVGNPDMYVIREAMRLAYLYAIYNDGKLNDLYKQYPPALSGFLNSFDCIFTTNYDLNIEQVVDCDVIHLHGQFDRLSDVYNENSLRNKLPDAPIRDTTVDSNYMFLYCNAITTHSGAYKEFMIQQNSTANECINKMAEAYKQNPESRKTIESWIYDDNKLITNLGYAIRLKATNPDVSFTEQYDYDSFKSVSGELIMLGISPWNDLHLFRTINASGIERCTYYYWDEEDCTTVKSLLCSLCEAGKLVFESAKEFWRGMEN